MDYLVIAIVSLVALAAHVAIYWWVKFKVDEGVAVKYLDDHGARSPASALSLDRVSGGTDIESARLIRLASRSQQLRLDDAGERLWLAGISKL